jgi:hypothetical protein
MVSNFDVVFHILGKPYQESISQTRSKTRAIKQFGKLELVREYMPHISKIIYNINTM